jgi:hypothetical protein
MMIPSPECIVAIVEDYSLKSNLYSILLMIAHEPVRRYEASVAKYNARTTIPSGLDRLEKRVLNLEARQTLAEAELALLRGLFDRSHILSR